MVGGGCRAALLSLLILAAVAPPAGGQEVPSRGFTAEDLVAMEGFGGARVDGSGRWVIWERRGPYDTAATYAFGTLTSDLLTDLVVTDARGLIPDRVIGADDPAGYRAGPISPDGRRMMVHRLTPEGRTLGVLTFETGEIVWTDLSVDLAILGRTAGWRNDGEILAILTPQGRQPLYHRLGWETQAATASAWEAALAGRETTALQVWSGQDRDRRPQRLPGRLVRLEVETGQVRLLAEGEFFDLEVSPDGTRAALLENAGEVQTSGGRLAIGDPTRRRRLRLVEIDAGRVLEPLPDRDLMSHLLSWSSDGSALLVFSRAPGGDWADGVFHRVQRDGRSEILDLGGDRPAVLRISGERIPIVRGAWIGPAPAVLVEGEAEPVWREVSTGRRVVADRFGRFFRQGRTTLFESAEGLGPWGGRQVPGRSFADDGSLRDGGSRAVWNSSRDAPTTTVDADGCLAGRGSQDRACLTTGGRRVAAAGGTAVLVETKDDGTTAVHLSASRGARTLGLLNPDLAHVDWGQVREIAHAGVDGRPLKSWLLLPPRPEPEDGHPLVVLIYPGQVHPTVPALLRPGSERGQINALVLASAGYAVLVPSLPLDPAGDGSLPDLADRIDRALDAALAGGGLDPDRMALVGHSYGGRGVLIAGGRTQRYRALIASAGTADYAAGLRDTLHAQAVPADGLLSNAVSGYYETGQGGMGSLPWEDPQTWAAASPLYGADRIRTPALLIRGDLDPVGAEVLFSALYRLNREASLITYRGEGHVLVSPANILDLHARVLSWLEERLAPNGQPPAPAPEP